MKILTDSGFKTFDGIRETGVKNGVEVVFDDGSSFRCSDNHAVKLMDSTWCLAKELEPGDTFNSKSILGIRPVSNISTVSPIGVAGDFSFYSKGVTHHNCAFVENWEEFSASVLPTISSGKKTKLLYTSTPKGLNHFYKIFTEAKEDKNGFKAIEAPWWVVPGRDEEWKQDIISSIGGNMEQFAQEYCVEFMGSSGTLIAGWKLKELVSKTPVHQDKFLKVYESPSSNSIYMLVADVSRGKGLDYSAFSVFDVSGMPFKQVATYRSNIVTPTDYANIINNIGRYYNYAQVIVEVNDIGGQVADTLFLEYDYENVLKTVTKGRTGKVLVNWAPPGKSDRGVRTTTQVKRTGCSLLKLLIEQNQLVINDHETIHELSTFSAKGASYEAEPGRNDDMVMGLVIFAWASTQSYFKQMTDTNTLQNLRDSTKEQIEDYLLPFGIKDDGIEVIGGTVDPSEFGWF